MSDEFTSMCLCGETTTREEHDKMATELEKSDIFTLIREKIKMEDEIFRRWDNGETIEVSPELESIAIELGKRYCTSIYTGEILKGKVARIKIINKHDKEKKLQ